MFPLSRLKNSQLLKQQFRPRFSCKLGRVEEMERPSAIREAGARPPSRGDPRQRGRAEEEETAELAATTKAGSAGAKKRPPIASGIGGGGTHLRCWLYLPPRSQEQEVLSDYMEGLPPPRRGGKGDVMERQRNTRLRAGSVQVRPGSVQVNRGRYAGNEGVPCSINAMAANPFSPPTHPAILLHKDDYVDYSRQDAWLPYFRAYVRPRRSGGFLWPSLKQGREEPACERRGPM